MTDDLIARLRCYPANRLCRQVADALEAKDARIAELTAALKPFADEAEIYNRTLVLGPDIDHWVYDGERITFGDLRTAAAALKETGSE